LSHEVENIRSQAASALPAFFTQYYQLQSEVGELSNTVNAAKRDAVITMYTEQLAANNKIIRMGFSLALGKFLFCSKPKCGLKDNFVCHGDSFHFLCNIYN